jgi:phosphatidylglycerophosphate synthase
VNAPSPKDYQPTSRRPIADTFRRSATVAVDLCVRWKIHPDAISYASIVAAAAAAVCFWQVASFPWLLLAGPVLCGVRLWLNMLDGMVALAAKKASYRGEILNDMPDRASDVLIFVGVAHSGLCAVEGGYWAAILAVLTAYVGVFGQAVGVQREFSGIMSKPLRMVTLGIGAVATFAAVVLHLFPSKWGPLSIMDWTCVVIIAGCVQTVAVRLRRILKALAAKHSPGA